MNGRDLACLLDDVREVVRAVGIDPLPGTRAPVSGMLELRNDPLPVIDLRSDAYPGEAGDVLVLNPGPGGSYGVAVDRVLAVVSDDELVRDEGETPAGLPPYVIEVLRRPQDRSPVLLVAVRVLAGLDAVSS
jgi:chemotaxis signal transduction protein